MMRTLGRPAAAAFIAALFLAASAAPALAASQQEQWELQVGQQQYMQLMQQGKIVQSSPLYDQLAPVAKKVEAVADPQYFTPFHFMLVNEREPNAFAVPGGNVYVTTGLMSFVHSQDELAGVLCHEVSHDIHHDVYNENQRNQRLQTAAGILGAVMGMGGGYGGYYLGSMAAGVGAQAQSKGYSRKIETAADQAGAYNCAKAGYNPWAMIWLFQRMQQAKASQPQQQRQTPQWLSDHPKDDTRIADLEKLFNDDPATFGKFANDPSKSVAMVPLKEAYNQQGNPYQQNPYQRNPYGQYAPQSPQGGYGYPQQGSPYPQQGSPYPQQGSPYPTQPPPGYGYPGYPQQGSPYPTQPPGYGYPGYPQQGSPYPTQPPPGYGYPQYPQQGSPYPTQPPPGYGYPGYPMQGSPYPTQPPPGYGYPGYPVYPG